MFTPIALTLAAAVLAPSVSGAAIAQTFEPPADCPTCSSTFYAGVSNGSLPITPVVPGKAFDRFVQIWLENTNFAVAASNTKFQKIAQQGLTLEQYNGVTHPSEPNYIASIAGDFYGLADDAFYYIPSNGSTIVDLLEAKNVSWATYQENEPYLGYQGDYAQANLFNASNPLPYTYYKRKHNPFIIHNSIANVSSRVERIRNFNNFAQDVNASALPSWVYITPNLVNDGHDTTIDFLGDWVDYFLSPLLANPNFNDNRTLILLTFDENEDYTSQNTVFSVLLGGALPSNLTNTTDSTYYTHYSSLSTVEHNWDLGNLGRNDVNKTLANVFSPFANVLNYTNNGLDINSTEIPLTNLTGIFPGPLNSLLWKPLPAPTNATMGSGGGVTFVGKGIDAKLQGQVWDALPALNLTGQNPQMVNPNITAFFASGSNSSHATGGTTNNSTTKVAATSAASPKLVGPLTQLLSLLL